MLIEAIREQITKIDDNEYDGVNGHDLRALDIQDLRVLVDRLEDSVQVVRDNLDNI